MSEYPDNCPKCNAPVEFEHAWEPPIYACGRDDDGTGEGFNACDYAASLHALVKHGDQCARAADDLRAVVDLTRPAVRAIRRAMQNRDAQEYSDAMRDVWRLGSTANEALDAYDGTLTTEDG